MVLDDTFVATQASTFTIKEKFYNLNLKKYKCAKSGCGHLTNSIIEMVTHKNDCIGSPGFGSVQNDNGLSVKKIKVMRRDGSLPGLKCEHCPNINYSFVSMSDLRRHVEEIHEGRQSDQDQSVDSQEPQVLQKEIQDSSPLQITTVSSSTPKEDEVPRKVPRILRATTRPRPPLRVNQIQVADARPQINPPAPGQEVKVKLLPKPPKPIESCSMLMVSRTMRGLDKKKMRVLKAEAAAHNVEVAER